MSGVTRVQVENKEFDFTSDIQKALLDISRNSLKELYDIQIKLVL